MTGHDESWSVPAGVAAGHRRTVGYMAEIEYAYVRVANAIEADVRSGKLPDGARLPNERDLGAQYEVAAGTARRAVRELKERGLVKVLPGLGTFIIKPPS